ncbi:Glyoxylate reductase/hydroxypyruvate reductase [Trichoplax sp. H2]|nr:Glyoxylate reductase/hydroxypyruvate reductase [Trichoplax sp. H2]|eukprot:RDD40883.1 Glyoxylate reductase/hydroxypyruvate reductase [Trichoplax sp. H2]
MMKCNNPNAKIFVVRELPPESRQHLLSSGAEIEIRDGTDRISREELIRGVAGCHGLLCTLTHQINKEILDAAGPNLMTISTVSVGFDHIDIEECKRRNITVGHTPAVLTEAVAELTIGLLLTTARRVREALSVVESGSWCSWKVLWLCGTQLSNKVVGIVGLGRIGLAVAKRLLAFNVNKILYTGHSEKAEVDFNTLLHQSDIIIVCCALTPETNGLFGESAFAAMKKNCIFINTSRGKVVNQSDLYNALVSNKIQAAGLDVTTPEPLPVDHPLKKLKNCVIFPHLGSATIEARNEMWTIAVRNLIAGLNNEPLPHPVY